MASCLLIWLLTKYLPQSAVRPAAKAALPVVSCLSTLLFLGVLQSAPGFVLSGLQVPAAVCRSTGSKGSVAGRLLPFNFVFHRVLQSAPGFVSTGERHGSKGMGKAFGHE